MNQETEKRIIERVRQGNANAFSHLVVKYQDIVFSMALKMVGNRDDAAEMAQETFIRAFRSLASFREQSRFSTWLYRIAFNTCISSLRSKRMASGRGNPDSWAEEAAAIPGPDDEESFLHRRLNEALRNLPEDEYLIILLYYYEEQSIAEISQITGLGESNIKVRLHRIRNKLRIMMDGKNREPAGFTIAEAAPGKNRRNTVSHTGSWIE